MRVELPVKMVELLKKEVKENKVKGVYMTQPLLIKKIISQHQNKEQ